MGFFDRAGINAAGIDRATLDAFRDTVLEKVRVSAQQAVQHAQDGMAQGQARLDSFYLKRQADGLLRDLGAAYYAQQRTGGSAAQVDSALARLDAHAAEYGPLDTGVATAASSPSTASAAAPPAGPAAGQPASPTPPPTTGPVPGNYSLDDLP